MNIRTKILFNQTLNISINYNVNCNSLLQKIVKSFSTLKSKQYKNVIHEIYNFGSDSTIVYLYRYLQLIVLRFLHHTTVQGR